MSDAQKVISDNRQARFLYEILEVYEAGIALTGTEVKSLRAGKVNLKDGFVRIRGGEAFLLNVHISPQDTVGEYFNHDPRRNRKLLLHDREIRKLIGQTEQKGLTMIPLKMYFKRGWVKVSVALARGKKIHDKRDSLKQKQDRRDMERAMKTRDR
ncbi:MAG: SsrA-binding protein SmpB [Thermosynechococcaceae cyanobacterium]